MAEARSPLGLVDPRVSLARVCDCKVRHRVRLALNLVLSCLTLGVLQTRLGVTSMQRAASGQQCLLRCSCELAGAVRASSLVALETARQAWKVLTGGWTAVCSWLGSWWPWWAAGEDLNQLHASGSKCGCGIACSDACTVCLRVVTPLISAENDVHSYKTGQPTATVYSPRARHRRRL